MSVKPTRHEINNLSAACDKLWGLDENRLVAGEDYKLDLGGAKRSYDNRDKAADSLFQFVDSSVWEKPTFKTFRYLLDNYERETGVKEEVTREEKKENWDFLHRIMETKCMKYCHAFLVANNLADASEHEFLRQLYKLWFWLYRREGYQDSSGFEHVFVGESKRGKIVGFHNWIQFYLEETNGDVDYRGYILPRRRNRDWSPPDGTESLLTIQFEWEGEVKTVSSTFIGTSPEFEIALYTMCFLAGKEINRVEVGDFDVDVKCYKYRYRGSDMIATTFPMAVE